jgi:hypothetical protein
MSNVICQRCIIGWHHECFSPVELGELNAGVMSCCCFAVSGVGQEIPTSTPAFDLVVDTSKAPRLKEEGFRDQTSTGRKRAAVLYPIPPEGMLCEWAGLSSAGGGPVPIVGCRNTRIVPSKKKEAVPDGCAPGAIHHGPDKSTINNEPWNVSRICTFCHNRWHALNDPFYSKDRPEDGAPYVPLSGAYASLQRRGPGLEGVELVEATEDELLWSEAFWKLPDKIRVATPYLPPRRNNE